MKRNLLILTPEKDAYSTTFIKAHFDHLAGNKKHLFGIYFPTQSSKGSLIHNTIEKSFYKVIAKVFKKDKKFFFENAFLKYVKRHNIDLVLAEFGPVGAEVTNVCKKNRIPLIVHFHGFDAYSHSKLKKYHKEYVEMFSYASSIIAVSKHMEDQLLKLGAPSEKVIYNCYGPSNDFFDVKPNFNKLHFVTVGRFVDKKAPYLALAAFYKFQAEFPGATLTMAGDGPLLFTCKNLAKSWNIADKVDFVGPISHERVKELYQSAYCFLQHSIVAENGDSEGTPLGILEASAAGIPIISTKHAGISDVVIHGETGFLVNEGDVNGMAGFMKLLAQNFTLTKDLGMKGRKRIKGCFSLEDHINILDHLIEKAINEKSN